MKFTDAFNKFTDALKRFTDAFNKVNKPTGGAGVFAWIASG